MALLNERTLAEHIPRKEMCISPTHTEMKHLRLTLKREPAGQPGNRLGRARLGRSLKKQEEA